MPSKDQVVSCKNAIKKSKESIALLKIQNSTYQQTIEENLKSIMDHENEIYRQERLLESLKREQKKTILFTDHAIVRYLERVSGADLRVIQDDIIDEATKTLIHNFYGTGTFPHKSGCKIVVQDYRVVTILPPNE